jgi:IMP dehydrogenase
MVGAAIGATGDFIERAAELVKAHVDVIVIDIAHGHSVVMAKAIDTFRKSFPRSSSSPATWQPPTA